MVKSLSLLAMAGAVTAYNSNPRAVLTPVPPPFTTTPIPPVTTPVYSSTVTRMTTYYPSMTDEPGAIATHKVTSTRQFDPSTYHPGPTDACHGGVIIFNLAGDVTTPLKVGFALAKISTIAHTNWADYHVYEAVSANGKSTALTALVCDKKAFDKTIFSLYNAPAEYAAIGDSCNHVVFPDANPKNICVTCAKGEFLFNGKCEPCTPMPTGFQCLATEVTVCTNTSDSKCVAA
eukprot:comp11844_c0_seq1/m.6470 comp11844_c0_seq1/g.6470  ORF comp11844_c0_seq1/g.6470 comp11844_c0_seq1/m.6470 type:complete len:233 (-) comp11844_c0_seq1:276-974(-)